VQNCPARQRKKEWSKQARIVRANSEQLLEDFFYVC